MINMRTTPEGLIVDIVVQPRASKAAIVGHHQEALKIKLTAPPVGGAANKQCIEILAKALSRPKSTIELISGQTNRRKQLIIRSKTGAMDPKESKTLKAQILELVQ